MPATLLPYWRLFLAGIHQQSTYRLAMLGGLVANATFGFLKAAVLLATVHAAGGNLNGYDVGTMSAYVWLSQGLLGSINLNGRSVFADRIKTGDVAINFARPIDVQSANVATEVGQSVCALLPRGLPSVAIGALVVGMAMPTSALPYLLGTLSLLLGFAVSATTVYALNTVGFWLVETRGVQVLYMVASGFLAGLFVPIGLFPTWLHVIATATPFPSMMQYPVDLLSGRTSGVASLEVVATQLFWLALTWLVGHVLTRAGRRKLEIQGG